MPVKPLLVGALAAACVAAAVGGAYVAVRQSPATPPASVSEPAAGAASAGSTSSAPVTETEGVVTPPAGAPDAVAEVPAPAPAPAPNPERTPKKEAPARHVPPAPASKSVAVRPNPAPAAPTRHDAPVDDTGRRADSNPPPSSAPARDTTSAAVTPDAAAAPTRIPDPPPVPRYVEVVVPTSAVIGLQVDRALSSETAKVEDRIEARVTRDVMADGQRAIPAGSKMLGSVVLVDRGGKMKDAARLGVRFHTLVLADGTELPLRTETIYRDGDSPGNESSRKVGGAAVGGAILGAILGGGKGAVLGGAAGAAGGTAAVMAGGRNPATLPAGTVVTARVAGPVTVQVEKE